MKQDPGWGPPKPGQTIRVHMVVKLLSLNLNCVAVIGVPVSCEGFKCSCPALNDQIFNLF